MLATRAELDSLTKRMQARGARPATIAVEVRKLLVAADFPELSTLLDEDVS